MKNLAYLNKYLWKYRGRLFVGFVFIVAGNVLNVYAPMLVGEGIDFLTETLSAQRVLKGTNDSWQADIPRSLSWLTFENRNSEGKLLLTDANSASTAFKIGGLLALGYLLMYLVKGLFLFVQRQSMIVMSRYIEYDLKNEVYNKYQELDAAFYKRNRTGDLMNRIGEDVTKVRMYLGPAIMYTVNLAVLVFICVVVMLRIDAELTFYTLLPLPFMMLAIFYVSTIINRKSDKVQTQQSALSAFVQETVSGIRVLRAFDRERFYAERFEKESDGYKQHQLGLVKTEALFMPVILLLVGLSTILTIYIGSQKVMEGSLTAGVIVQFVFYVNNLTWPFASVGWVTSLVQKAEASMARINEFLRTKPEVQNTSSERRSIQGDIEFSHVSFTYPDTGITALKDVSFEIKSGETLAIVGRTGSGKSTLANLLVRMFDAKSGSIKVDGIDIVDWHLEDLRSQIGYVPQETFLFSDTIRNNIGFGKDNMPFDVIERAAKQTDMHEAILSFPNGYETLLGERGINLSGGQKQRLSIARAIAKDPQLLIFDDCLSAVDTVTEERILSNLYALMQGKTSIIIAHRISTVRRAKHILVLEHGKIVERGNHESLNASNGIYAGMYEKQLIEHELI